MRELSGLEINSVSGGANGISNGRIRDLFSPSILNPGGTLNVIDLPTDLQIISSDGVFADLDGDGIEEFIGSISFANGTILAP